LKDFSNKQQMDLGLDSYQQYSLKNVFKQAFADMRRQYPEPVEGETKDEYVEFLYVETLLEVSERIKKIALSRDNLRIAFRYNDMER